MGISRALRWTTVEVSGDNSTNRPGVLSYLAGLVSQAGGNILRTVSMTNKEGQFQLRMILRQLGDAEKALLTQLFNESRFKLDRIEIV